MDHFIARNEGFELNNAYTPPNVRYGNNALRRGKGSERYKETTIPLALPWEVGEGATLVQEPMVEVGLSPHRAAAQNQLTQRSRSGG